MVLKIVKHIFKAIIFPVVLLASLTTCSFRDLSSVDGARTNLVKFVNPLIGSKSGGDMGNGSTYPAVTLPFGMNFWSPQTAENNSKHIYSHDARTIRGFRCTHSPGASSGDYGAFSLMPQSGELTIDEEKRASRFFHSTEISTPYYYKVNLENSNIISELVPTQRGAIMRFTFPESEKSHILLDAFPGGSYVRIVPQQRRIIGYAKFNNGGVPKNFACYFVIQFSKNFNHYSAWNETTYGELSREISGEHTGAAISFPTQKNEIVEVKIATSFISIKQAIINLRREVENLTFDQVKIKANQTWNIELNKIQVEGSSNDQKTSFYTAFYRTLLLPRIFYEFDENGKMVHFSPFDGKVHPGYMFTDSGFWDSYRGVFPFFSIMYPEIHANIMQGLINTYRQGGWLPVWPSPGYRKTMIGAHAAALFTDAYLKGINDFDVELAYQAMKKDAIVLPPKYAPGRDGLREYNEYGFVPTPDYTAATSKTLDYAYDDFCIMQMAKKLNRQDDADLYKSKALNYKNVFDPDIRFMRGKKSDGTWKDPFDPTEWGGAFVEGNAWHNTWSVQHDVAGMIELMGGQNNFVQKLDSVFSTPSEFKVGSFGRVTYKMTEMILSDMGQYAHNTRLAYHLPYLYSYAGQPWKTQKIVRDIIDKHYRSGPDGLSGDDDSGHNSAWYLFSSMGFYPLTPGHPSYVLGAPLFKKITMQLDNGNKFIIEAPANSNTNVYAENIELNGSKISANWINHTDVLKGGKLYFEMTNKANRRRGSNPEDAPFSLSAPHWKN
ncbi:MAG: GH92 family glycosyl hydrolase [Cyclobacteriaceae bacterium]|nr:GH92 family glycosyl hydrolase [Cyclobacteriaceae bacterium]